ncbi:MAG: PAS domain S-box protein [Synechococcales cyanobacterium CRU_2_2]|nr:PAS domain S-box protein [Synechococcales cyanobacterium CRU_2_2]
MRYNPAPLTQAPSAVQTSLSIQDVFEQFNQSQSRLGQFFDVPLDMLCCLNRDGQFQAVSFSWLQTLGWRADDLQGHYWGEWVHPQDLQTSLLQLNTLINQRSGRRQYRFDCRFRHRDGSYRWLAWKLVPSSASRSGVYGWVQDITEQKLAEPQGFEHKDEFLQLAETLRDVFWIYDPVTNQQLYVSPAYERVWGRSCQSLYEDPASLQEAIHPDDRDYVQSVMDETENALLTGGGNGSVCSDLEYRIVRPDHEVRWIHDRSFPLLDSNGKIYRFIGVAEDITDRRQTEQECDRLFAQITQQNQTLEQRIAQRTAELRAIIDAIPDQICVITRDQMRIDYCNAAFVEALEAPDRQSLEGKTIYECFPPDEAEYSAAQNHQVFSSGHPLQVEESLNWGGQVHHLDTTKVPLHTPQGEVYALVSASRNISAFKAAEAELRNSQAQFRAIFEQAAVGISLVSPDGKFLAVNQKFCSLLGYSQAELGDMTFQEITDPHHLEADLSQYHRLLNGEIKAFSLEKCFIRKDGGLQWAALTVSGVYDEAGQMKYDIGVLQDISDRKQGEQEVVKALAKERELNELKSRVISMISHEYRTPLTVILSSTELLERYGYDNPKWNVARRRVHFERIENSVTHLTELVNDVLFLNRAEADRLDFNPAPLDVVGFFKQLLPEIRDAALNKVDRRGSHPVKVFYPKGRPVVCIDSRLLRHIVSNLFSNAVKYSPEGDLIKIYVRCVTDELQFVIADQGIGIPAAEQAGLFDSFRRAANVGTIPGTGLGLSIVKKCVDIHQGQIKVRSTANQGTRFSVSLPSFRA